MNMTSQTSILFIDAEDRILNGLMKTEPCESFQPYFTREAPHALGILDENDIQLIVSDVRMLQRDDLTLLRAIKHNTATRDIPIIVTSDIRDRELDLDGLKIGRFDYISRPFDQDDICARIEVQLKLTRMHQELKTKNEILSSREEHLLQIVEDKTAQLEKVNLAMVRALQNACYINDHDTGNHLGRVSRYCVKLAEAAGCGTDFIRRIKLFAPLHDVGKVGIPDSILKKESPFTAEEARVMEQHVVIGARFLDGAGIDPMAYNITLYHHEKWDGAGYVKGLKGEAIPLEARILSIADVYDALSFDRVYRRAMPEDEVDAIMRERSGNFFDPRLIDTFFQIKDQILEIKKL